MANQVFTALLKSTVPKLIDMSPTGKYVPVSRGKMRNVWFPSKIARYAVGEELKAIKAGKIEVQRDVEFGAPRPKLNTPEVKKEEKSTRQKVAHLSVSSDGLCISPSHINTM